MTALHYAASGGHEEIVELLLAKGADVNAKAKDGKTPLDMANGATADLLRTHGGQSGLIHVAVRDGDLAGVQALLDAGADVSSRLFIANSGLGKDTLLHFAARHGHEEIVELLISEGADVNAKDENSWTPLHFAARHGHKEIVELLIAKGADVNATNNFEDTPLDVAIDGEIADSSAYTVEYYRLGFNIYASLGLQQRSVGNRRVDRPQIRGALQFRPKGVAGVGNYYTGNIPTSLR